MGRYSIEKGKLLQLAIARFISLLLMNRWAGNIFIRNLTKMQYAENKLKIHTWIFISCVVMALISPSYNQEIVLAKSKETTNSWVEWKIHAPVSSTGKTIKSKELGWKPQGWIKDNKKKWLISSEKDVDYWEAYDTAKNLISKWEWLRLKSYWDNTHCSIWYWFTYPCWKTITQKEADKMLADSIHNNLIVIRKNFPKETPEAQWALASFKHNCPRWYSDIQKNWLKWFNSWCRMAWWESLKWLVNRRADEWKIIKWL